MSPVPLSLRRALRAEFPEPRCAYCHSPEKLLGMPLEVDHIIAEAEGGKTELANVCLCCRTCNSHKWRRIRARDPLTGWQVRIFHPRRHQWARHFAWSADGVRLIGLTVSGRADRGFADEQRPHRTPATTLDFVASASAGAGAVTFLPPAACLFDLNGRSSFLPRLGRFSHLLPASSTSTVGLLSCLVSSVL